MLSVKVRTRFVRANEMTAEAPESWLPTSLVDLLRGRPFQTWRHYASSRGMSPWRDVVDWVGGYPFEVARPEQIFGFYHQRGYELERLRTSGGGHGCNEFVFRKRAD